MPERQLLRQLPQLVTGVRGFLAASRRPDLADQLGEAPCVLRGKLSQDRRPVLGERDGERDKDVMLGHWCLPVDANRCPLFFQILPQNRRTSERRSPPFILVINLQAPGEWVT